MKSRNIVLAFFIASGLMFSARFVPTDLWFVSLLGIPMIIFLRKLL